MSPKKKKSSPLKKKPGRKPRSRINPKTRKFTDIAFLKAIAKSNGSYIQIASLVGCTRATASSRINGDPKLRKAFDESLETKKDTLEDKMFQIAMEGNVTMLIWLSKCLLRDRGYIERQQQELVDPLETAKKIRQYQRALDNTVPKFDDLEDEDILPDQIDLNDSRWQDIDSLAS